MTGTRAQSDAFETAVLPFLDDAYTLARYLVRNEHDAQDIVQEAFLRALRYFDRQPVENPRAWLLTIVRRTCYTWHAERRADTEEFNDVVHSAAEHFVEADAQVVAASTREQIQAALDTLPSEFREVLVLRELQELSYRDISDIISVPIGTVMSRLSRARLRLHAALAGSELSSSHRPLTNG